MREALSSPASSGGVSLPEYDENGRRRIDEESPIMPSKPQHNGLRKKSKEDDVEAAVDEMVVEKPRRESKPIQTYHDWPVRIEYLCWGYIKRRRIGALIVLFEWEGRDGRASRFVLGPYWHLLILTLLVLTFVNVGVYGFVVPIDDTLAIARAFGLLLAALSLSILIATGTTDPGICPRYVIALGKNWTYSEYAQAWRPPGAVYCKHLHLLISDYHHFCPWTGTAIGANNEMYFHALIFLLCLSLTYNLVLVVLVLQGILVR